MTEAIYPQVRIVTERLLNPETVERVMNLIIATGGIRRVILNGPRLPATITSGPAKGKANIHEMRQAIVIGDKKMDLQVHVGTILLELENRDVIPAIQAACDQVFTVFTYALKEGRFMKTEPSLVDYAKYGPGADKAIIGMADPSSKSGPVIIQGIK